MGGAKCLGTQQALCRRLCASSVVERPKVVAVDVGSSSPLDELSKLATLSGTESVFGGTWAHYEPPKGVEEHRNRLRQRGAEAEKDNSKREEVLADAIGLLHYEHPLVRLAAVHTVARVAAIGDNHAFEAIAGRGPTQTRSFGSVQCAQSAALQSLEMLTRWLYSSDCREMPPQIVFAMRQVTQRLGCVAVLRCLVTLSIHFWVTFRVDVSSTGF